MSWYQKLLLVLFIFDVGFMFLLFFMPFFVDDTWELEFSDIFEMLPIFIIAFPFSPLAFLACLVGWVVGFINKS